MVSEYPKVLVDTKRFSRFSLRTLLILVTAACIFLGMKMSKVHKQNQVVDTIGKLGGKVLFKYENKECVSANRPSGFWSQSWLRRITTSNFFREAVKVDLSAEHFSENPDLQVTDAHIAILPNAPTLEVILLAHREKISDESLKYIAQLKRLRIITLGSTGVEGRGLRHLVALPKLEGLHLAFLPLSDADILPLASASNLKWINLNHTNISDNGLSTVGKLASLEKLYLNSTEITDAGLTKLYGLSQLRIIMLGNTNVTNKGFDNLQQALPGCKILSR